MVTKKANKSKSTSEKSKQPTISQTDLGSLGGILKYFEALSPEAKTAVLVYDSFLYFEQNLSSVNSGTSAKNACEKIIDDIHADKQVKGPLVSSAEAFVLAGNLVNN